ncbi:MAG TPA: hypothetical protein VKB46_17710, partial [Pyrinomonadaceae bacterium]|nr:hypothetical protein [Pyrinomonadaceae bacterium]
MTNLTTKLFRPAVVLLISACFGSSIAQSRKAPPGGRTAVVIDERLAAVRSTPSLSGVLVRRLGRGKLVAVRAARQSGDGPIFLLVNLSSRT